MHELLPARTGTFGCALWVRACSRDMEGAVKSLCSDESREQLLGCMFITVNAQPEDGPHTAPAASRLGPCVTCSGPGHVWPSPDQPSGGC